VLIVLTASLSQASDRIVYDESSATMVFRGIAVSDETFNEQYVISRCRQFLAQNADKKLIVLTLGQEGRHAPIASSGCDHCKPYPFWRRFYDAVNKEMFPIGELMVLGGNAVVRYRDTSGSVTETALVGINPRPIGIGEFKGKIVHVGMSGRMPKPWLQLYVVGTGILDAKSGAEYISNFSHDIGVNNSTVEFRSDPWFMNEVWRPWFPLFEEHRGEPPSEAEFSETRTLDCMMVLTLNKTLANRCSFEGWVTLY
jgi:hypothetical protein